MSNTSPLAQVGQPINQKPKVGVLLVHGLNGSRHDMQELSDLFYTQEMITENILLPGHGSNVRDMLPLGWPEWSQAVRAELHALQQRCDLVFLVGHSLGGALCLHAAAHEEVAGIVTMCAPISMHSWMIPMIQLAKRITPLVPTMREDVRDPEARRRHTRDVYRWTPMAPVESMLRFLPQLQTELAQITAPALVMVSVRDHVVPARDGRRIYSLLGSQEKHLVTLHRSYHVIMKDHDREEVFAKTIAFVQQHVQTARHAPANDQTV